MHPLVQTFWGDIWKYTVEKSLTTATNVTLHPHKLPAWGDIYKHTVEKSQTNVTNVTMHPLKQVIWGDIWKHTVDKNICNPNATQVQPIWLCIFSCHLRTPLKIHSREKSYKSKYRNLLFSKYFLPIFLLLSAKLCKAKKQNNLFILRYFIVRFVRI